VIALLKPGKEGKEAADFRPVSLLSVKYKILERLVLEWIQSIIDKVVPIEQAGFRENRSCTEQVLALTAFIKTGYQKKLKASVAFVELSAANDTVWRQGLMYKLTKTINCRNTVELINNMLTNRLLRVFLDSKESRWRKMNDELPQGSVLAPTLFNLYMNDLPKTEGTVFQFADDIAIAY